MDQQRLSGLWPWSGHGRIAVGREHVPSAVCTAMLHGKRSMAGVACHVPMARPALPQRHQKIALQLSNSPSTRHLGAAARTVAAAQQSTPLAVRSLHVSAIAAAAADAASKAGAAAVADGAKRKFGWLVLAPTFLFTHVTLAWGLVPPVYFILRQTSLANTLLAGPQGAFVLSRRIPQWVPDGLVNPIVGEKQQQLQQLEDGSGGQRSKDAASVRRDLTVEDLVERLAQRGVRTAWRGGSTIFKGLRKAKVDSSADEEALARDAVRQIGGGGSSKHKGEGGSSGENSGAASDLSKRIRDYAGRHVRSTTEDIKLGQIRDGVAAWVLVKVSVRAGRRFNCRRGSLWLNDAMAYTCTPTHLR